MLILLSPAKTFHDTVDASPSCPTDIRFEGRTRRLVARLREFDVSELGDLMNISESLAELNVERFTEFPEELTSQSAIPAGYAFAGDVYQGLRFETLESQAVATAQGSLRILSGLYGLLRPLDLIHPYRLEMGTKIQVDDASNLYEFWADSIADAIRADVARHDDTTIINLASNEYSRAAQLGSLSLPVVEPRFLDQGPSGDYKVISFHAKRARGVMARWLLQTGASSSELPAFDAEGYVFDADASTAQQPTYRRSRRSQ